MLPVPSAFLMRALNENKLLEVDDVAWSYGDAVLHGLHSGTWQLLEARTTAALQALAHSEPDEASVDAEVLRFRRARHLHAAEDLRVWLAERNLTSDDVIGCARRAAARAGASDNQPSPGPTSQGSEPDVRRETLADVIWAESLYDGTLAECADGLARSAAAAAALRAASGTLEPPAQAEIDCLVAIARERADRGLGSPDPGWLEAHARTVIEVSAAHEAFAGAAATPQRAQRLLTRMRLDLTRVRFDDVVLDSPDAAREALMCAREDGLALAQVAARALTTCATREGEIAELDASVRAGLSGARPGDVIGPLPAGERWHVLGLRDRVTPRLDDPVMAERIREQLVSRALERTAAGRVRWHGSL